MLMNVTLTPSPIRSFLFSVVIFLLPALALAIPPGIGLIEAAVLLGMLIYAKPLWTNRTEFFGAARWIVLAFGFSFGAAILSVLWFGSNMSFLDNPSRQLLVAGAIGLIPLSRPRAHWLWYGVFTGTLVAASLAVFQRFGLNWDRAGGFHQIIMFGDIAMALALISLAGIAHFKNSRWFALPYLAFLAGVSASILSGTRGGWGALILVCIPLYLSGPHMAYRKIAAGFSAVIGLAVAAYWIPAFGVAQRLAVASSDFQLYAMGNSQSSLGARFEMWRAAWKMLLEHPWIGVGRANFNQGLNKLIAQGEIDASVKYFHHAHSEMLHALATEGMIGGLALALVYGAPLVFFISCLRRGDASQSYAMAGLLLVLSFIGFGTTQVLFSHHIGSGFYALMVFVLAGLCIAARNQAASVPPDPHGAS